MLNYIIVVVLNTVCKFGCEKIQWKLLNYAFLFSGTDVT